MYTQRLRTYKVEGRRIFQSGIPLVDKIAPSPGEAVAVIDVDPKDWPNRC